MFWLEENLILSNVLITGESNFDEKNVNEVFNMWTELHTYWNYFQIIVRLKFDSSGFAFDFNSSKAWNFKPSENNNKQLG